MKFTILCTDPNHPVVPYILEWQTSAIANGHMVHVIHDKEELPGGDILFLVSCSDLIRESERKKYHIALVLHASNLPIGRGWSPHIWAIVNGEKDITVCLLEADDPVDSGAILLRKKFSLEGHELLPEINKKLFTVELELMSELVDKFNQIQSTPQKGQASYLPKRTPEDSRLDPDKTLAEQFNLLRVVDSERYPAFMDYQGKRYLIKIEKAENNEST